jgi:ATP-dependent Lon protease
MKEKEKGYFNYIPDNLQSFIVYWKLIGGSGTINDRSKSINVTTVQQQSISRIIPSKSLIKSSFDVSSNNSESQAKLKELTGKLSELFSSCSLFSSNEGFHNHNEAIQERQRNKTKISPFAKASSLLSTDDMNHCDKSTNTKTLEKEMDGLDELFMESDNEEMDIVKSVARTLSTRKRKFTEVT